MFSVIIMPISTNVPMAMAIPERDITFESTPSLYIAMNAIITASGRVRATTIELLKWSRNIVTMIMVIIISSVSASFRVPIVS